MGGIPIGDGAHRRTFASDNAALTGWAGPPGARGRRVSRDKLIAGVSVQRLAGRILRCPRLGGVLNYDERAA